MFHPLSKYFYLAAFSLLAPAWVTGQDKPAAGQPQYKDPQLTLWKQLKASLTGPDGASYFEMGMKGAMLPPLKGKVVKLEPDVKPNTVVLALEDGTTADATLKFETPLAGKVDLGTELSFEGVAESYTASPYMVVFNVDPDNLHGWTGKNAPRPPVHKKATASN
jgi:hypothetical protein